MGTGPIIAECCKLVSGIAGHNCNTEGVMFGHMNIITLMVH